MNLKAVIYCRVPTSKQKTKEHRLESQEHRYWKFAAQQGIEAESVFKDDYIGGSDFEYRPAMTEILRFLDANNYNNYIVIFDNLKRLARDNIAHRVLRFAIKSIPVTKSNF